MEGSYLQVLKEQKNLNAQSPKSSLSQKHIAINRSHSSTLGDSNIRLLTPVNVGDINGRNIRQKKEKNNADSTNTRYRNLEEENTVMYKKIAQLETENRKLRKELKTREVEHQVIARDIKDQNTQLQEVIDRLYETINDYEVDEVRLRKERNQLRKVNTELSKKIGRLNDYLQVSKSLATNLQRDKQQLLQLVNRHNDLLTELQTAQDILGNKNTLYLEEIELHNTKIQETEFKVKAVNEELIFVEEGLFTSMALCIKLAMHDADIPLLPTTIDELYSIAIRDKISKTNWANFIVTSLEDKQPIISENTSSIKPPIRPIFPNNIPHFLHNCIKSSPPLK